MANLVRKVYQLWTAEFENSEMSGEGEVVGSDDLSVDDVDGIDTSVSLTSDKYIYDMNHQKRGKFIIINNRNFRPETGMSERSGTDKDASALHSAFKRLGFDVFVHQNLTKDQMLGKMIEAARHDHSDCDCFATAVLSHGDNDVLYGVDNVIAIDNFVAPIKGCRSLIGKPKLFFFQACRGTELDSGLEPDAGKALEPNMRIPMEADFLYAYSTVPGYFSWRNSSNGSWFVQALAQILDKPESEQMEFVRVMTRVNNIVAYQFESNASRPEMNHKKQVPSVVSMLTKDLYLAPKK